MTSPVKSPRDAAQFCAYLKAGRAHKALTLAEISRITKVPKPSLERLEAGEFDRLPAEVFVRGFLRSYARCVGMDADEVVRRYVDMRAGKAMPPSSEPISVMASPPKPDSAERGIEVVQLADDELRSDPTGDATGDATDAEPKVAKRSRLHATGSFITRNFFDDGEPVGSRRGAVTLAVIILVIVATLTMSYLLRRPSYSGDGVTRAPVDNSIGLPGLVETSARVAEDCASISLRRSV